MQEKISRLFGKKIESKKFNLKSPEQKVDANWIINKSGLPCLKLDIQVPYKLILQEIESIPHTLFVNHRDEEYESNRGWKSFVLHGRSYDATREDHFYNDNRLMAWTKEALIYCPETVKYFQTVWPCNEFYRVRIMLLEPQGIINLHADDKVSKLSAVNIAISQPKNCNFYLDHYGVIPFEKGDAYLIDISNLHTVINNSDLPRYHIIVHHKIITKEFDSLVEKSYNNVYASQTINPR